MNVNGSLRILLVLPLLLARCATPEADPGTSDAAAPAVATAEIQGGAVDSGDAAVGLVWIASGGFCTGTLIAPDVVLTAGHCVESEVSGFYTGTGLGAPVVSGRPGPGLVGHAVVDQVAHPSYRSSARCPNPSYDVALLRLARPIAGVKPLALATMAPTPGERCRAVGYGVHDEAWSQTVEQRRAATEEVIGLSMSAVHVGWGTGVVDHGDSGGPLLCARKVAGTTSCGTSGGGPDNRDAWYGRVDPLVPWITEVVADWRTR